ncbi:MAG TPA: acyl-[acyl-carrier-protein]--UDP-N-acetylglucosamine O-acyltransferase, partial [Flavobacteriales bacterium]|nr:acyl-[acyl-carrier-protein]--UDP-N-acetylglucosamine O-acyltransferase [Flavobacteriales bacterium]
FVAGGSLVRKNVPPFVKAAREPLSYVGVNSIGLKRRGFDESTVKQIEDIYRLLYVMNDNTAKGVAAIELEIEPSETRTYILDFVAKSDKGIMRGKGA